MVGQTANSVPRHFPQKLHAVEQQLMPYPVTFHGGCAQWG